jgi:hypothetical protein
MSEKDEKEENSRDKELFKNAFRWRKPIIEKLTMQRLFQATMSHDPFIIIEHTVNAASMVETQKQKVKGLDFEEMRKLSKLNFAFHNVTKREIPNYQGIFAYCINFPFAGNLENYKTYIEEWKVSPSYYPSMIRKHRIASYKITHKDSYSFDCRKTLYVASAEDMKTLKELTAKKRIQYYYDKLPDKCPKCNGYIGISWGQPSFEEQETTIVHPHPEWSFFFEAATCLAEEGYNRLRNAFSCWAKDKCGHAIAIMSSLISPNVYDEIAKMFKTNKPEGESSQ